MEYPFDFAEKRDFSKWWVLHDFFDLHLLETARAWFVWKGRNSASFNRCFILLEGTGALVNHSEAKALEMRPGHAYFMPPRIDLGMDFRPGIRLLSLHFQLYLLPGIDLCDGETHCSELELTPDQFTKWQNIFEKELDWHVFCNFEAMLWQLVDQLVNPAPERWKQLCDLHTRYRDILQYIQQNITARTRVDDIAILAGQKRDTFSRNFSHDIGIPLKTFLMNALVRAAEQLLLQTDLPLWEIAAKLEFSSEFYFSNFFKRHKGYSPSLFREMHRI